MAGDWPPPLASRAIRRHCVHQLKGGYCVHCGLRVASADRTPNVDPDAERTLAELAERQAQPNGLEGVL